MVSASPTFHPPVQRLTLRPTRDAGGPYAEVVQPGMIAQGPSFSSYLCRRVVGDSSQLRRTTGLALGGAVAGGAWAARTGSAIATVCGAFAGFGLAGLGSVVSAIRESAVAYLNDHADLMRRNGMLFMQHRAYERAFESFFDESALRERAGRVTRSVNRSAESPSIHEVQRDDALALAYAAAARPNDVSLMRLAIKRAERWYGVRADIPDLLLRWRVLTWPMYARAAELLSSHSLYKDAFEMNMQCIGVSIAHYDDHFSRVDYEAAVTEHMALMQLWEAHRAAFGTELPVPTMAQGAATLDDVSPDELDTAATVASGGYNIKERTGDGARFIFPAVQSTALRLSSGGVMSHAVEGWQHIQWPSKFEDPYFQWVATDSFLLHCKRDVVPARESNYIGRFCYNPETEEFIPGEITFRHNLQIKQYGASPFNSYVRGIYVRDQKTLLLRSYYNPLNERGEFDARRPYDPTRDQEMTARTLRMLQANGLPDDIQVIVYVSSNAVVAQYTSIV